jgi:adenine-specific DNA methylase
MTSYETSAMVQAKGEVRVVGVPFAPGTEVEVTISPKDRSNEASTHADNEALAAARARMRELFRAIRGFRVEPKIPREELYERGSLH